MARLFIVAYKRTKDSSWVIYSPDPFFANAPCYSMCAAIAVAERLAQDVVEQYLPVDLQEGTSYAECVRGDDGTLFKAVVHNHSGDESSKVLFTSRVIELEISK